jgi:hypothetical protein
MSHRNHNYTNYSNPKTSPVELEATEEVVEPVVTEETVAPEPEDVQEEDPVTPEPQVEPVYGVVTECVKLNVRKEPDVNADVVTTLSLATEVLVDVANSTEEFYKIVTGAGVEGYCMKQYINID